MNEKYFIIIVIPDILSLDNNEICKVTDTLSCYTTNSMYATMYVRQFNNIKNIRFCVKQINCMDINVEEFTDSSLVRNLDAQYDILKLYQDQLFHKMLFSDRIINFLLRNYKAPIEQWIKRGILSASILGNVYRISIKNYYIKKYSLLLNSIIIEMNRKLLCTSKDNCQNYTYVAKNNVYDKSYLLFLMLDFYLQDLKKKKGYYE